MDKTRDSSEGEGPTAYSRGMRWEALFDDLEGQWLAEERRERDADVADRTRAERVRVLLVERLAGSLGCQLTFTLTGAETIVGTLDDLGADWLLLTDDVGHEIIVATGSVLAITGLSRSIDPAATARRFTMGYALRALARDRATVILTDTAGGRVAGTIDAVGKDWCDISEHPVDEARRPGQVRARRTVPTAAIVTVRKAGRSRFVPA